MVLAGGLYLGPFLAGLSGHPGWTVGAFGLMLGLWSFLYQPSAWPSGTAELATGAGFAKALVLAGVMLVIAAVAYLAGSGLSHLAGTLPLPLAATLAVPAAALALALCLQPPRRAAALDAVLDDALRQLKRFGPAPAPPRHAAIAAESARRIAGLAADAGVEDVRAVLAATRAFDADLLAAIDRLGVPPPRPARIAAILLVADPEWGAGLAGRAEAAWVFDIARGDPELETLFADRALLLLAEAPGMWRDMPYAYDVDQARQASTAPEAAARLHALRDRLNALSLADA